MKAVFVTIAILGAAVALSGQPSPKPAEASPAPIVAIHPTSELSAALNERDYWKAEAKRLATELAQAKSAQHDPLVVPPTAATTYLVASGGAVCANGSCGVATGPRRVFVQRPQRSGWYPGKLLRGRRR